MHKIKKTFNLALLSILLIALSACGSGAKKVVTQDDSADYKSATSLPPLKKPSVASSDVDLLPTQRSLSEEELVEPELVVTDSSGPQTVVSELKDVASQAEAISDDSNGVVVNSEPVAQPESKPELTSPVQFKLVAGESNNSRLEIDAGFNKAWSFVTKSLKSSDVTVFSRNRAAGRLSIGCGEMESAATIQKKGGWSFFNKAKGKRSEYCALSVVERRGKTYVFVLNRDNTEVSDQFSKPLFARILNN